MDHSVRYRPGSPSGHRMVDPMRASTGTVPLSSSYGLYESSASRPGYTGHPSEIPYMGGYPPRTSHEPRLEVQPISSTTYRDPGHSTKLRTEYAIRPRPRSSTTSAADTHLSPARLDVPSPVNRHSPVVATSHRRSPSPLPNHGPYLVPASSSHHARHNHTRYYPMGYGSDTGRVEPHDRRMKIRMSHGTPRDHDRGHRSRYPAPGGFRKGEDIDDYDAYSYTNPREQFEKESVARLNHGRSVHRGERPLSLTGPDDPQLLPPRRDPRALGPPPSHRGFGKIDRDARSRHSAYGSIGSDADQKEPKRMSWQQRRPVSVHQDYEDGYSSYRDDHEGRRHHHRNRRYDDDQNSRQSYEEIVPRRLTSSADPTAVVPATGLGTAVLAAGYGDDSDYDLIPRSDRHHSRSQDQDPHGHDRHRQHHRSRRSSRRKTESESDGYTSDEDLRKYRREPSAVRRHPRASESSPTGSKDQKSQHLTVERAHRRRSSRSRHRAENGSSRRETSSRGSGSSQEDLKQTPQKDSDGPPKSILKKPREKFPEEPNPIREGVAPLKDAGKKGIPPGARWTKIDRRLVNPAALEAGNERYEERPEYVIVLRVLSKEDIQAYAVKTQEIRDTRYQEYLRERRKRIEDDRLHGPRDGSSSDDEDEEDEPPRRLEGPTPSGQPTTESKRV